MKKVTLKELKDFSKKYIDKQTLLCISTSISCKNCPFYIEESSLCRYFYSYPGQNRLVAYIKKFPSILLEEDLE